MWILLEYVTMDSELYYEGGKERLITKHLHSELRGLEKMENLSRTLITGSICKS